jgi:hypothetical protein
LTSGLSRRRAKGEEKKSMAFVQKVVESWVESADGAEWADEGLTHELPRGVEGGLNWGSQRGEKRDLGVLGAGCLGWPLGFERKKALTTGLGIVEMRNQGSLREDLGVHDV